MTRSTFAVLILLFTLLFFSCQDDDDNGGGTAGELPVVSIAAQNIEEGNSGFTEFSLRVKLDKPHSEEVQLNYATQPGLAQANDDYLPIEATRLSFAPEETEKEITLLIIADELVEENESFTIVLSDVSNATLATTEVTMTILNDDEEEEDPFGIPGQGYTGATSYPGYSLVWEEQFNGSVLNSDNWTYEIGTGSNGWGNNELQYYREQNTHLFAGHLVIEAKQENFGGNNYTSSRLVTLGKQNFQYGRIDIRAALPQGQGIWPALWMLGSDFAEVGWPACGEIDIMELVGNEPNRVHGTVHYGVDFNQHQYRGQSSTLSEGIFADEFHLFTIIWEEDNIQWFVDDVPFFEFSRPDVGSQPWPFNDDFFFIVNLAVGGNWPGSPNASTQFPQYLFVDYIRVFQ
jgi:hypothetical protein